MFAPYRRVLSIQGARRLFATALFARLPQGMSSLAILLVVRESTHSYAAAGAASGAYMLATAVASPVQGRLIDHYGRSRVLAPVAILQGGALVLFVLAAHRAASAGLLVILAGLSGALVPSIAPTLRALLRDLTQAQDLRETAYALESVAQELIWILGPVLVALVVAVTRPSAAVLMLGVVCISGTILFVRSPLATRRSALNESRSRVSALVSPSLRMMLGPIGLTGMGLGALEVGLPSLALHAGSRPASGLLLALWALGSMVGGLWFGSRIWQSTLAIRYLYLLLATVALTAPLIVVRSIPAAAACAMLAGLAVAPLFSCQYALVARSVIEGSETEAFTWANSALVAGIAAGSATGGALISSGGVGAPFMLCCLSILLAAVMAVASRRRLPQPV